MRRGFPNHTRFSFRSVAFAVCLMGALWTGAPVESDAADFSIEFDSEKLSVDISQVSLEETLGALSGKTGITVFLDRSLKTKQISAKFTGLPLDEGIKRLIAPYSSAIVYEKRSAAGKKDTLHVSELKVFDRGKEEPAYIRIGKKGTESKGQTDVSSVAPGKSDQPMTRPIPERVKDPARAVAHHKRVNASVIRSRIVRTMAKIREHENKMRREEEQKRRDIREYEMELQTAPEEDSRSIQAKLNLRTAELGAVRQRNAQELNRLRSELDQLKRRQTILDASMKGNDDPSANN